MRMKSCQRLMSTDTKMVKYDLHHLAQEVKLVPNNAVSFRPNTTYIRWIETLEDALLNSFTNKKIRINYR